MTLDLQATLPEDLARRVEHAAAQRGLPLWEFLSLLLGIFAVPQMRLSEDRVIRDLSDELMLHFQKRAARMEQASGKALDLLPDLFAEKPSAEEIAAELKNHRVPQSLAELKPRLQPPPGQTIKDMLPQEPWPGDETDAELLAALKAMG